MCSNEEFAGADPLAALAAAVAALAGQDLTTLPDPALAGRVLQLRAQLDRAEAEWLRTLAAADARGAAGAEAGAPHPSTTGWLRAQTRTSARHAAERVRLARALHRGRLPAVAAALAAGQITPEHAAAITRALRDTPPDLLTELEPVALDLAGQLDPADTRRALEHLRYALDPDAEDERARRRLERRGLDLSPTLDGMLALSGLLDPEAGETVRAAITALAAPEGPDEHRSAAQRRADALTELARRSLDTGDLPATGGVRPHMSVVIDWAALLGQAGSSGGEFGWGGLVNPAVARRLACDAALTRVIVQRDTDPADPADPEQTDPADPAAAERARVRAILRAALDALPPLLGGAPSEPLDLGRTTRTISPAQRRALTVRDGGCRFPGCSTPPIWCDGHHIIHWIDGGPTDMDNLVLLCRRHHRTVHEGGWTIHRDHTGPHRRIIFTPPARGPTTRAA
jgi:Domain of unknown function (DUF222)/HNH endonuclease